MMNLNKPLEETPRMNKKSQTETKDLLADTLLSLLESKPFPKITVNELCTKSMIWCGIKKVDSLFSRIS